MGERGFVRLRLFSTCLISILLLLNMVSPASAQTDVSSSIGLNKGRMTTDRATAIAQLDVALENIGSESIQGPLWAVIDSLTDQVTVENADGTTDHGKPYYLYDGELGDGNLGVQEISSPKTWYFHNPNNLRFSYSVVVLAGSLDDQPPTISITNPLNGAVISNTTPWLTAVYQDAGSGIDSTSFSASIDGTDMTAAFSVTESQTECHLATALAIGEHTLRMSISDNDGNAATMDAVFQVTTGTASPKYLFSVANNDWIFASAGDGNYIEYIKGSDLGLNTFADVVGLSKTLVNGPYYFTRTNTPGVLQSQADGTQTMLMANADMGLSADDRVIALHKGLDNLSYFALLNEPDIRQTDGSGTFSFYLQNEQLGLNASDTLGCLHIGYDNTIYFCSPAGQEVLSSMGDNAHAVFVTAAQLGVPGGQIDAFAIFPETTPPQLSITNPFDGAFVNTATPNVTIAFSDTESGIDVDSFYAELDGVDISHLFTISESGASYQVDQGNALSVGNHGMNVSVADLVGNQSQATSNFTVGILRALPGATPISGTAPLTVIFSTAGEDPAGTIQIFRWDFDGNGSWDSYDTVARDYTHTYNNSGTYNAVLYVQSSTGATATATITISVENNPPAATADVLPSNGEVPLTVQMTGAGTDVDGTIVLYEWDYEGDGTFDWSSSTTGNTSHTYTEVGSYQAVFRVTDNSGLTGTATATTTVIRTGPPGSPTATASASPSSGNAPLNVNFSGTATDPDNEVVLYEWDFDSDGTYDFSSATSGNTSHAYTEAGTHTATLRVTDATGLTGIDQILITVNIQTSLSVQNDTVGFFDAAAQSEIASANASSQYSASYPPDYAIDGNSNTYWIAAMGDNVPESWFEVTFSRPQRLNGFAVHWYSSAYKMDRGRVEIYDENSALLYSQETDLAGVPSQVSLPSVENAMRLRLVTVSTSAYYYHIINEFVIDSTPMDTGDPDETEPKGTNINTTISAGTPVTIFIKDQDGNTVRTLVNNAYRSLGTYADYWDCKDDSGVVVHDGVYHAVMQYIVDGQVRTLDLTDTTGGTRYDFPISSGCNTRSGTWTENFSPFDDKQVGFQFTLCSAQEVTFFIGPLWTGADQTRIRTILNRQPFPAGTHTIYWDGLDDNGNIAQAPAGDQLITGAWRYSLPNNAMFMTGGSPEISNVSADPNYFSPFSEKCDENGNGEGVVVGYTVSEDVASVELRVYSVETGSILRTLNAGNTSAGDNVIFWDGKNNNGEYVDIGDYRIGISATDSGGNTSLFRYTLVRIDY